ncbi:cyclic nucleotide-binding domain-containing protein [Desulfospira joergensenii]|uniref:cyclic nucleotide-binding domain-containing protein n=1 Tax=Desulfospira joergensenii TaxID=53329 RepID=UPI0003B4CDCB|nr:cyclic nucleotide-binding domain-containing protein [Desulfospira joergensenii]
MNKQDSKRQSEKHVVILLCDMVGYSQITADMGPVEIRDFIVNYHCSLREIINSDGKPYQPIEPSAGDGAISIFEKKPGEAASECCDRAVSAAVKLSIAMGQGCIPKIRIGLFEGDIIETSIEGKPMRCGASFSAAKRLEELCGYFGTSFLMDRGVAIGQSRNRQSTVSIGKITPRNLDHPIHVYTIYKPGIHQCPPDVDPELLSRFIELKNEAVNLFFGHGLQGIFPDFPRARERLSDAQNLFSAITGKKDLPSEKLLDYIDHMSVPVDGFIHDGVMLPKTAGDSLGIRLLHFSNELLWAMNLEFYHTLVVDTEWERCFTLIWKKKGQKILGRDDSQDDVYYIESGSVVMLDGEGRTYLSPGNVFGGMFFFPPDHRHRAMILADSDVVLRKISGNDLKKHPMVMEIFKLLAMRRIQPKTERDLYEMDEDKGVECFCFTRQTV